MFPFQFVLPNHLPGTFSEEQAAFKANIKYKVKAEVVGGDGKTKLKHSQQLVVREPLKQVIGCFF